MRFTVLTASSRLSPRNAALVHMLDDVGHDVTVGRVSRSRFRQERITPIAGFAPQARPDVLVADTVGMLATADRMASALDSWVARRPDWTTPRRDWMTIVPDRPELSTPVGFPVPEREPWTPHEGRTARGRHAGKVVALAFRSTPGSPAHYLHNALLRAGVEVRLVEHLDFNTLGDVDAVVVVESPTPPLDVSGTPAAPVVFWVHHGEHHLEGNVRLSRRYRADLVLLAHSWHLSARFDARAERFPFAVAPELLAADTEPVASRPVDLAFVGRVDGSAYERRRQLIDAARSSLDRVEVASDIGPVELMDLYRRSRSVLNDGGSRHRPITMRVFEAIGAGAMLVSETEPGLDLLFGGMYQPLTSGLAGLRSTLDDPEIERMVAAARDQALRLHTYDHRVDLLFRLLDDLGPPTRDPVAVPADALARFFAGHPYGQRILDASGSVDEPDREVWQVEMLDTEPNPRSYDTVVLDRHSSPSLALCARRFVVGRAIDVAALPLTPRRVTHVGGLTVVDVGGDGYDVETVGGPSAIPPGA